MTPATVAANVLLALLQRRRRSWRELRAAGFQRGQLLLAVSELAGCGFTVRVGPSRSSRRPERGGCW
jgi:hypothetical protein